MIQYDSLYEPLGYNYKSGFFLEDDFTGGTASSGSIGERGWAGVGTIAVQSSAGSNIGIYRFDTGAVQATQARVFLGTTAEIDPSAPTSLLWVARLNTNDANTTMRIGAGNSTSADPPNHGIYFEKLDGDTNWFCVTRAASSQTRTDSGVVVSTNFVVFRYVRTSLGVTFSINGTPVVTNQNATIPTTFISPWGWIINSAAAAKTFDIDYFRIRVLGITR